MRDDNYRDRGLHLRLRQELEDHLDVSIKDTDNFIKEDMEYSLMNISYKPEVGERFIDENMRLFTENEVLAIILREAVGGQADVISISSDDMENNDTDDGIIDLTGDDD